MIRRSGQKPNSWHPQAGLSPDGISCHRESALKTSFRPGGPPVRGRASGDYFAIGRWGGDSRWRVGPRVRASRLARTHLLIGLAVRLCLRLAQNAELVTFRIRKYNPGHFTLTYINSLCAMGNESSHLGGLVIWPEVQMESTLARLGVVGSDEIQPRLAIWFLTDLKLLRSRIDHHPSKSLGPPFPEGSRIQRVHNHLFPLQNHQPRISVCPALAMEINPPGGGTTSGRRFPPSPEHALDHFSTGRAARKGNAYRKSSPLLLGSTPSFNSARK